ncbi:hypothetical protein DFJ73DRAFT_793268 [Zopfochytrium polystomum]|nr:hypothetical protein DFJ73DRAFT_793268 [Zopfochytrium polystomum]
MAASPASPAPSAATGVTTTTTTECKAVYDLTCYANLAGPAFVRPMDVLIVLHFLILVIGIGALALLVLLARRQRRVTVSMSGAVISCIVVTICDTASIIFLRLQNILLFEVFQGVGVVFVGFGVSLLMYAFIHPLLAHVQSFGPFMRLLYVIPIPPLIDAAAIIWLGVLEYRCSEESDPAALDALRQEHDVASWLDGASGSAFCVIFIIFIVAAYRAFSLELKTTLGPTLLARNRMRASAVDAWTPFDDSASSEIPRNPSPSTRRRMSALAVDVNSGNSEVSAATAAGGGGGFGESRRGSDGPLISPGGGAPLDGKHTVNGGLHVLLQMHPESAVGYRTHQAQNVNPYFKQQMDAQTHPTLRSADSFSLHSSPNTVLSSSSAPSAVFFPTATTSPAVVAAAPTPLNPYPPPSHHQQNRQRQRSAAAAAADDPLESVEREIRIGAVRAVRTLVGWIIVCLSFSAVSLIAMKGTGMMLSNGLTGFAVWVAGNMLQLFCIAGGVVPVLISQYKRYALETAK